MGVGDRGGTLKKYVKSRSKLPAKRPVVLFRNFVNAPKTETNFVILGEIFIGLQCTSLNYTKGSGSHNTGKSQSSLIHLHRANLGFSKGYAINK